MYRKGFTLIEIMIAIMVFAIGILTVLRVMTQNTVLLAHSKDKIQASLLARE
jgi:prepilin-type N-terminal cleavage/methylation domain-containing protein